MTKSPNFITDLDFKLLKEKYTQENELKEILSKIKNGYPVQYAIGNVDFLNSLILVDERVLIPRFETELLVDIMNKYINKYNLTGAKVLDVCTGSGCISIALKLNNPNLEITGLDISLDALDNAKLNAKNNNVDIKFIQKDILKNMDFDDKFTILISNPPYVKKDEYVSKNTKYEPNIALYPGDDDILFYKKILDGSKKILNKKNLIAFEIGCTQAERICEYAKNIYPDSVILVRKDYNNRDRFIFIFNNLE